MLRDVMDVVKMKPELDLVRAAKAERARKDAIVGKGYRKGDIIPHASRDRRWQGWLGEQMFARFLEENDIPHVFNGGVDDLPDFVIYGQNVSMKTCHGLMYSDFFVFASARQKHHDIDWFFFSGYNSKENILNLIGALPKDEFYAKAQSQRRGTTYATTHNRIMPSDTFKLPARELTPVVEWLAQLALNA